MEINGSFSPVTAARARVLLGAQDKYPTNIATVGNTALVVNNAYSAANAAPADANPIAPGGGFVPGDHLRANTIGFFKTVRDNDCQEAGVFYELVAETGATGPSTTFINDGKTCLAFGVHAKPGGGKVWGAAGGSTLDPGWTGTWSAALEIDSNNNAYNAPPGNTKGNIAGIYQNGISHYKGTVAHWINGVCNVDTAGACWELGTYYQEGTTPLINSTVFYDGTNSDYGFRVQSGKTKRQAAFSDESSGQFSYLATGAHTGASIRLTDTAPVGLDIQGGKQVADVRLNGGGNVALKIEGNHSLGGIDVTGLSGSANAITLKEGQIIKMGAYEIYPFDGRLFFRVYGNPIASLDGVGNFKTTGSITGNVAASSL